jgi:hypothetical protein
MKQLYSVLLVMVILMMLMVGVSQAQECKRLGVKDCRPSTTKGVCYWWECQQTGSVMQMIFTGKQCDCPRSELNIGNGLVAKSGCEIETTKSVKPVSLRTE